MVREQDCNDSENSSLFQCCDLGDVCVLHLLLFSVGINCTSIFCVAFPNIAVGFPTVLCRYFARHCCWHRNFQLSTNGFDCELEFFIVWLNEEYSSQLSGIVEFWFLDSPSLFRFLFRCIRHLLPQIWPHTDTVAETDATTPERRAKKGVVMSHSEQV